MHIMLISTVHSDSHLVQHIILSLQFTSDHSNYATYLMLHIIQLSFEPTSIFISDVQYVLPGPHCDYDTVQWENLANPHFNSFDELLDISLLLDIIKVLIWVY